MSIRWIARAIQYAGDAWYWKIGIVEDDSDHRWVRIEKNSIRPGGEIAQSQRVNLRPKDWPWLRETIERMLATLQEMEVSEREETE